MSKHNTWFGSPGAGIASLPVLSKRSMLAWSMEPFSPTKATIDQSPMISSVRKTNELRLHALFPHMRAI